MPTESKCVTCIAPSNIATIKYWGKRDEELILPLNDSISVTLCPDLMRAKTTICASQNFKEDKIWLNGIEENFNDNKRLMNCLEECRRRARATGNAESGSVYNWKVHVCSENNFPTAAGLASSAAGYACLVYCLAQLYSLEGDLTSLARLGSGSACRSLMGGFVRWHKGTSKDGTDSIATQIAPANHWPELRCLILIVKKEKKTVSSSSGMKRSVLTSELLQKRTEQCVPSRVIDMTKSILNRDFARFAEVTMMDSNQFHAICLDTYPPAVYMTDTSHTIVSLVHAFNATCGETKLAYTFDAGPNACLYFEKQNAPLVISLIKYYFPQAADDFKGELVEDVALPSDLMRNIDLKPQPAGLIKGMIFSSVGDGPKVLKNSESLLGRDGLPI